MNADYQDVSRDGFVKNPETKIFIIGEHLRNSASQKENLSSRRKFHGTGAEIFRGSR
jgi:hypothetical protein